jgi:bifunctional DNA-binding transcriptional regulator/antitoxin component of YhaV-PrlF toxin-antitoxin module
LVIPASLRRSLGLTDGDRLIAREEAGRLVLEKQETIK